MPSAEPLGDAEVDRLLAPFRTARALALAVSGGPDSTALMVLAAGWRDRTPAAPPLRVLTVDHALRPASAAEAAAVATRAAALRLPHETLTWAGPKPAAGLQAAARQARYRLLAEAARRAGCDRLLTAHTLDDQAETVLMALARGSGVYGLAAMPPSRPLGGLALDRPFLDVPKARLVATLEARGETWAEDPSNRDPRFRRAETRRILAALAPLGLDVRALSETAARMARAAAAIDATVDALLAGAASLRPGGYVRLDHEAWMAAPAEVRLRALARLIRTVAPGPYPPRLARLEELEQALRAAGDLPGRTLGGARVVGEGGAVWLFREFGRGGAPALDLAPGASALWDGRFDLVLSSEAPEPVHVAPAPPALVRRLRPAIRGPERLALATLPAFFRNGAVAAVPALGHWTNALSPAHLSVRPAAVAGGPAFPAGGHFEAGPEHGSGG
ncbi:tRNA lysidine(34) synthetase TilS [Prosthecomicrobium sp. N25]|uniref:tRNA lysidine(34) synthetase TilS n=1 Tax=Prosthecomicrobium sp. N25 TaxID=3129254 RepID=UPI003077239C